MMMMSVQTQQQQAAAQQQQAAQKQTLTAHGELKRPSVGSMKVEGFKKRKIVPTTGSESSSPSDDDSTTDVIVAKALEGSAATTKEEIIFQTQFYKSYIKSALDAVDKRKDHTAIDKLANQINLPQDHHESLSLSNLAIILRQLSQEVSRIDNKICQGLIISLINLKMVKFKANIELVKSYQIFLTVLASGIPKWWNEISMKLVSMFVYDEDDVAFAHEIVQKILNIIPTSIHMLQKRITEIYPNKNNKKQELVNYVKNLLRINDYCQELRFQNWSLIVENCIKLDVELQNELDDLDDADAGSGDEAMMGSDDEEEDDDEDEEDEDDEVDHDEDDDDEEEEDEDEIHEAQFDMKAISDLASKLDSIMCLLLEKTTKIAQDAENTEVIELYNIMSSLFKSHILPTHFTRCVQYLLFNLATRNEQLMDSFLYLLIEVSFQQKEILNNRLKSMQYISSFIARCNNLPKDKLLFVTSFLIGWMNRFIQEREAEIELIELEISSSSSNLLSKFKLFYHCFQTLMYIFCFKYKDLKKEKDEEGWECGIDRFFQNAILTKFNPLKYSNENVVKIFADLSAKQDACYCFSILEKNNRENYGLSNKQASLNELNGYFPFDPLMLKKSKKFIQDYYVDWTSEEDDDEEEDEDDD